MRLMANENFPRRLVVALRDAGYDVSWVRETHRGSSDAAVLDVATRDARIVATFDKDFGSLAFEVGLPAPAGIILIRIDPEAKFLVPRVLDVLKTGHPWHEHFTTIEPDRVRLRALPRRESLGSS